MRRLDEIVDPRQICGIDDYFKASRAIEASKENAIADYSIRIAFLASFTSQGIKEILQTKCAALNVRTDFFVSEYQHYAADILEPDSPLYRFRPELIIIFIDTRSLLGELYLRPYASDIDWRAWSKAKHDELSAWIARVKESSSAQVIFHNFEAPYISPLGVIEARREDGFIEAVETLNLSLRRGFRNDSRVFVFDFERFCAIYGKRNIFDYKFYYLADIKLDLKYMPLLCDQYLAYIRPLAGKTRKCIVLDLDNTLWGGVVGEDGIEGIRLGPTPDGKPFFEFQSYLWSLQRRGILLAINSSNNAAEALNVIRSHPSMVLKEDDFAAVRINWDDKVSNLRSIAEELRLGVDSFVFIDDNPVNRDLVRRALPQVTCMDLPSDPALYVSTLMDMNEFSTLTITEEDGNRVKHYTEQRARAQLAATASSLDQYLAALETVVTIEGATPFNIPRIAQLSQKTNQFNMTTRRYTEEQIRACATDPGKIVVCARVEDKFGDNGIAGVAIAVMEDTVWTLDTFLLSCRVIGRGIEYALLAYIVGEARRRGGNVLWGIFLATDKNAPAGDFYARAGFELDGESAGRQDWKFNLSRNFEAPEYIRLVHPAEHVRKVL